MQIRVLGCSGSIAAGSRTTSFLVGQDILIDAGTGVGDLTLDELTAIDHIFITHSHLDHVLSIGLLADSVTRRRRAANLPPIRVHALAPTLEALRSHVFNGIIWPDFTRLPNPAAPVMCFVPIAIGDVVEAGAHWIEVLSAAHTVPAAGYAVWADSSREGEAWVYTGDTGPNPALWHRLAGIRLGALVIETAFRDDEHALAAISQHLCPSQLKLELAQLKESTDVFITHIKPGEVEAVMTEIGAQSSRHRIRALSTGELIRIGQ
jgi:ribonuclease BN (tRNA processing enzyme)